MGQLRLLRASNPGTGMWREVTPGKAFWPWDPWSQLLPWDEPPWGSVGLSGPCSLLPSPPHCPEHPALLCPGLLTTHSPQLTSIS